ncbi:hypothetical protein S40288_05121 [Stachybotrys chartarum IBT 40288]|nr:hypothetical protein S40288_05121 [Stachybotrys chartarum IBT 40288]
MSSFDLNAAIQAAKVKPHVAERTRRQLSDLNMGVSTAFPPDPAKEIAPTFINKNWPGNTKLNLAKLGKTSQDANGNDIPPTVHPSAVRTILRRLGYGEIWPPLPAPPASSMPQGLSDDDKHRTIPLTIKDAQREIGVWDDFVILKWRALRQGMIKHESKIQREAQRLAPSERGRPPNDKGSSSPDAGKENELRSLLKQAWKMSVREVRTEFDLANSRQDLDEDNMPAIRHPDLECVKNNLRHAALYDNGGSLTPWFDFEVSCDTRKVKPKAGEHPDAARERERQPYYEWAKKVRAAFLVPHLNQQDLSQPRNLLTMLHYRISKSPDLFKKLDFQACHIGRASHILQGWFCGNAAVHMGPKSNTAHPIFMQQLPNVDFVKLWDDPVPNHLKEDTRLDRLYGELESLSSIGEAYIVLLSQAVTYSFLNNVQAALLESYGRRDQEQGSLSVKRKLEFRDDDSQDQAEVEKRIKRWDQESMDNALSSAEMQSQYCLYEDATVDRFFSQYIAKFEDRILAAKNHIQDLFAEPKYFLDKVREEQKHHYSKLTFRNTDSPLLPLDWLKDVTVRYDLYYDYVGNVFRQAMYDYIMWDDLARILGTIAGSIWRHKEANPTFSFPEESAAPRNIFGQLLQAKVVAKELFKAYLCEIVNRGKFVASEHMRKYFTCLTPLDEFITSEPKEYGTRVKKSSVNLFPRMQVALKAPRLGEDPRLDNHEVEVIRMMHELLGNPAAVNLVSMKKIMDGLRMISWDEKEGTCIEMSISGIIEKMGILVDFVSYMHTNMRVVPPFYEMNGLGPDSNGMPGEIQDDLSLLPNEEIFWLTPKIEARPSAAIALAHLDGLEYQRLPGVPYSIYLGIYEWLDEHLKDAELGGDGTTSQDERMFEALGHDKMEKLQHRLTAFGIALMDGLSTMEVTNNCLVWTFKPGAREPTLVPSKRSKPPLELIDPRVIKDIKSVMKRLPDGMTHTTLVNKYRTQWTGTMKSALDFAPPLRFEPVERTSRPLPMIPHSTPQPQAREGKDEEPAAPVEDATPQGTVTVLEQIEETAQERTERTEKISFQRFESMLRLTSPIPILTIPGTPRARTTSDERARRREAREAAAQSTRSEESSDEEEEDEEEEPTVKGQKKQLKKKSWKDMERLYSGRKGEGTLRWRDVVSLMLDLGFRHSVASGGSYVHFFRDEDRCPWSTGDEGLRRAGAITFHKPHKNTAMDMFKMRDIATKLEQHGLEIGVLRKYYARKDGGKK